MISALELGYPLIGSTSAIITRLLQQYFPTPLEKAQHQQIMQSMQLARDEMAARAANAQKEWEVRRELLLTQIEANDRNVENRDLMHRWPLGVTAAAMVRASQKQGGQALNVIVTPNSRVLPSEDPQRLANCWTAFNAAVDRMQDTASRFFNNDVLFYWENSRAIPGRPAPRGQELVSTIQSLTITEPAALVQVALIHSGMLQLSWSTWGWTGDEGLPDSGALQVEIDPEDPNLDRVIERTLVALICALSDRFQLARNLQAPTEPRFPTIKPFVDGLSFVIEDATNAHTSSAGDALRESYAAAIEKIGQSAPHLAADLAASAALRCAREGHEGDAARLLERALLHHRQGLVGTKSEEDAVKSLMERFFEGPQPLKIQLALRDIRNLSYSDFVDPARISEVDEIIYRLGYFDNPLSSEEKDKVRAKLLAIITYKPTAAIMGKTGAGKSSLANALFGKDTFKVGHTRGTTRVAQPHDMDLGRGHGITILDMPGVGEDRKRDKEYKALYEEWLPKIDMLLWAIKADDRALAIEEKFFEEVVKPHLDDRLPLLMVVTQADAIHPLREWNSGDRKPGPAQTANLAEKVADLAAMFKLEPEAIIPVSAAEKFNLQELTHRMILALPDDKRPSMARTVKSENKTERTYREVSGSLDRAVSKTIGDAWRSGYQRSGFVGGVASAAKHVWKKLFG